MLDVCGFPSLIGTTCVGLAPPTMQLITPKRSVPASLNPTIQIRNGTLLTVPSVDPDDTVNDVAAVSVNTTKSPTFVLALRKMTWTGSSALGSLPASVLIAMVSWLAEGLLGVTASVPLIIPC